ncbi:MAG: peptide-methionine (S)-S-oxide reductase, partial [Candidatus Dormibacteraeota bacterium]|nr:peptide-methionine (S)-S-oxide reductase [Candidatus Dormibacteraeota bacterium]
QYRSVIFTNDDAQDATARRSRDEVQALWPRPVVTDIEPLQAFYPAAAYHQDYFANHPEQGYCQIVINPKLRKFREHHASRLKVSRTAS